MLKLKVSASLSIRVDFGRNGAFTFADFTVAPAGRLARRRDTCRLVGVQRGAGEPRIAEFSHHPARRSRAHVPIDEPVRDACAKRRTPLGWMYVSDKQPQQQ